MIYELDSEDYRLVIKTIMEDWKEEINDKESIFYKHKNIESHLKEFCPRTGSIMELIAVNVKITILNKGIFFFSTRQTTQFLSVRRLEKSNKKIQRYSIQYAFNSLCDNLNMMFLWITSKHLREYDDINKSVSPCRFKKKAQTKRILLAPRTVRNLFEDLKNYVKSNDIDPEKLQKEMESINSDVKNKFILNYLKKKNPDFFGAYSGPQNAPYSGPQNALILALENDVNISLIEYTKLLSIMSNEFFSKKDKHFSLRQRLLYTIITTNLNGFLNRSFASVLGCAEAHGTFSVSSGRQEIPTADVKNKTSSIKSVVRHQLKSNVVVQNETSEKALPETSIQTEVKTMFEGNSFKQKMFVENQKANALLQASRNEETEKPLPEPSVLLSDQKTNSNSEPSNRASDSLSHYGTTKDTPKTRNTPSKPSENIRQKFKKKRQSTLRKSLLDFPEYGLNFKKDLSFGQQNIFIVKCLQKLNEHEIKPINKGLIFTIEKMWFDMPISRSIFREGSINHKKFIAMLTYRFHFDCDKDKNKLITSLENFAMYAQYNLYFAATRENISLLDFFANDFIFNKCNKNKALFNVAEISLKFRFNKDQRKEALTGINHIKSIVSKCFYKDNDSVLDEAMSKASYRVTEFYCLTRDFFFKYNISYNSSVSDKYSSFIIDYFNWYKSDIAERPNWKFIFSASISGQEFHNYIRDIEETYGEDCYQLRKEPLTSIMVNKKVSKK